jgi:hypothetical protein
MEQWDHLVSTSTHCSPGTWQKPPRSGFLEKLLRMEAQTPFFQLIRDANKCQQSAGEACLVEMTCAGKEAGKSK